MAKRRNLIISTLAFILAVALFWAYGHSSVTQLIQQTSNADDLARQYRQNRWPDFDQLLQRPVSNTQLLQITPGNLPSLEALKALYPRLGKLTTAQAESTSSERMTSDLEQDFAALQDFGATNNLTALAWDDGIPIDAADNIRALTLQYVGQFPAGEPKAVEFGDSIVHVLLTSLRADFQGHAFLLHEQLQTWHGLKLGDETGIKASLHHFALLSFSTMLEGSKKLPQALQVAAPLTACTWVSQHRPLIKHLGPRLEKYFSNSAEAIRHHYEHWLPRCQLSDDSGSNVGAFGTIGFGSGAERWLQQFAARLSVDFQTYQDHMAIANYARQQLTMTMIY